MVTILKGILGLGRDCGLVATVSEVILYVGFYKLTAMNLQFS
jgi:hypothetical protein